MQEEGEGEQVNDGGRKITTPVRLGFEYKSIS
jgi:hypothetical protein